MSKRGLKEEEGAESRGWGGWQISVLAFNSVEDKGEEVLISLNQRLDIESVI